MNPQRIYVKNAQGEFIETDIYFCDKCEMVANNTYSDSFKVAEKCCNYKCEVCGVPLRNFMSMCDSCRHQSYIDEDNERWNKVTKVKIKTNTTDHFYNESSDRYYQDYDEMIENIYDDFCEWRNEHPIQHYPDSKFEQPYIYLTKDELFHDFELHEQLESYYEEYIPEDWDVDDIFIKNSVEKLYAAVDEFNKANKDKGMSWLPDYSIGVDISDEIKEDFETEYFNLDRSP